MNLGRYWIWFWWLAWVVVALGIMVLLPRLHPAISQSFAVFFAILLLLASASILQYLLVKRTDAQNLRRLIALKKAFDHLRGVSQKAEEEVKHLRAMLDNLSSSSSGEADLDADRAVAQASAAFTHASFADKPEQSPPMEDPHLEDPLFEDSLQVNPSSPQHAAPAHSENQRNEAPRQNRADGKDLRVLQTLAEQLLADNQQTDRLGHQSAAPRFAGNETNLQNDQDNNASQSENHGWRSRIAARVAPAFQYSPESKDLGLAPDDEMSRARASGAGLTLATIKKCLQKNQVDLHIQPIVTLPQRKQRHYQCMLYLHNDSGKFFGPETYKDIVNNAKLTTGIDNMLLFHTVQLLSKMNRDGTAIFFINIYVASLKNRDFLKDFINYLSSHQVLSARLIIQISQPDLTNNLAEIERSLTPLLPMGFRFAMDFETDFTRHIGLLERPPFSYIKINAYTLLHYAENSGFERFMALKNQLHRKGIDMIVTDIDQEPVLRELLDLPIDYGQGSLFGTPRGQNLQL